MNRAVSSIVAIVLIVLFAVAGVAGGYFIRGGSGGSTYTTTQTIVSTTTIGSTTTATGQPGLGSLLSVSPDSTSFTVAAGQVTGSPWFASWLLSQQQGYFKDWVPNAQLVSLSGGSGQAVQELAAGTIQMVIAGPDTIASAIAQGANIKIIANYDENFLTWSMNVLANSSYHSLTDLNGKNLGCSRPTSLGCLFTIQMMSPLGMKQNVNYTVTSLGSITALIASLESGDIDGFTWAYWGQLTPLYDQGVVKAIANYTAAWPYNVVAATPSFIQQHPSAIKAFLAGLYQGELYYWGHQQQAVQLLNQTFGLSIQDANTFYTSGALRYATDGTLFLPDLQNMLNSLYAIGVLTTQLNAADIVSPGFAPIFNVPAQ